MPVEQHVISIEARRDEGLLVFVCRSCGYCSEVETDTGKRRVLDHGDRTAAHSGGSVGVSVDIGQDTPATGPAH